MVNYCCVQGCGRNSKQSSHLNFYSLPKERNRQEQWLTAAGRQDILQKPPLKLAYRFCSRHFAKSSIKNRKLCPDAMPTKFLPNSYEEDDSENEPVQHQDIVCNSCQNTITGFRYKCVSCVDYDLCPKCEMLETHAHHYMLRIPRPLKFKIADDLITKWRKFFKAEHVQPDCTRGTDTEDSSDDEPITKYARNYDSGVDLSEDVKDSIRKEISRVLSLKTNPVKIKAVKKKEVETKKRDADDTARSVKKQKLEPEPTSSGMVIPVVNPTTETPEMVFADVNATQQVDVKHEVPLLTPDDPGYVQPLMHVKLSDDLTELMIEMTHGGEKTVYKYTD